MLTAKLLSLIVTCLMLCAVALPGCANPGSNNGADEDIPEKTPRVAEYHKMPHDEAKEIMDGTEPYILVDVRTQEEYDELHIQGAALIPVDELAERAETELPDKDALILLYCRSGARSKTAAETLVELGYTDVHDIGGITTWPYDNVE